MNEQAREDINNIAYDILKRSKSFGKFPTPVEKIVSYSSLHIDRQTGLHNIPNNYVTKGIDALARALRKVRGVLDRRKEIIYVDPNMHPSKQTFVTLHEVGHNIIPWQHNTFEFLDDDVTLSPWAKNQFESEANYFASAALFQLDRFEEEIMKLPLEILSAVTLSEKFGSSIHASIRRYIEYSPKRCAVMVLRQPVSNGLLTEVPYQYTLYSQSFLGQFGTLEWPEYFDISYPFVVDFLSGQTSSEGNLILLTKNGLEKFTYHFFFNQYNIFVMIKPTGEKINVRTKVLLKKESERNVRRIK